VALLGADTIKIINIPTGHQPAIVIGSLVISFDELAQRVADRVLELASNGINHLATVGMTISDELNHLIASLAVAELGADQITLASFSSNAYNAELAGRVGVTHWVADDTIGIDSGNSNGGDTKNSQDPLLAKVPHFYFTTSGTTQRPKLLRVAQQQLIGQLAAHGHNSSRRFYTASSIEHHNAKKHRLGCVYLGGTNVLNDIEQEHYIDCLINAGVTCLHLSQLHLTDLLQSKRAGDIGEIEIRTAGSAISSSTRRQVQQRISRNLKVVYGTSETGLVSVAGPSDHLTAGCVGRVGSEVRVKILAEGKVANPNQVGDVGIQTPHMSCGYWGGQALSSQRFIDGWFFPGDKGYIDEHGRLYIVGRSDDLIIMNGINIYPSELEEVLEQHPAVAGAAVIGIESGVHGAIPVAAVELFPGEAERGLALQAFSRERVGIRFPRKVVVLDQLPRNSAGKVIKTKLRDLI